MMQMIFSQMDAVAQSAAPKAVANKTGADFKAHHRRLLKQEPNRNPTDAVCDFTICRIC